MTQPIDRARRLLELAERDMISFRALSGHPEVDISATGFFAQQVVEKCLKGASKNSEFAQMQGKGKISPRRIWRIRKQEIFPITQQLG